MAVTAQFWWDAPWTLARARVEVVARPPTSRPTPTVLFLARSPSYRYDLRALRRLERPPDPRASSKAVQLGQLLLPEVAPPRALAHRAAHRKFAHARGRPPRSQFQMLPMLAHEPAPRHLVRPRVVPRALLLDRVGGARSPPSRAGRCWRPGCSRADRALARKLVVLVEAATAFSLPPRSRSASSSSRRPASVLAAEHMLLPAQPADAADRVTPPNLRQTFVRNVALVGGFIAARRAGEWRATPPSLRRSPSSPRATRGPSSTGAPPPRTKASRPPGRAPRRAAAHARAASPVAAGRARPASERPRARPGRRASSRLMRLGHRHEPRRCPRGARGRRGGGRVEVAAATRAAVLAQGLMLACTAER